MPQCYVYYARAAQSIRPGSHSVSVRLHDIILHIKLITDICKVNTYKLRRIVLLNAAANDERLCQLSGTRIKRKTKQSNNKKNNQVVGLELDFRFSSTVSEAECVQTLRYKCLSVDFCAVHFINSVGTVVIGFWLRV